MKIALIKYCTAPFLILSGIVTLLIGIEYVPIYFIIITTIIIGGDLILPRETNIYDDQHHRIFEYSLYITFPLIVFDIILVTYLVSNYYPLNGMSIGMIICQVLTLGLLIGGIGTNVGHELVHRRKNSFDEKLGFWFLAMSWDTAFGIEHVHGHHKCVATWDDPASARRGENTYRFILRSSLGTFRNAWRYERNRMKDEDRSIFSYQNRMVSGSIKSILIAVFVFTIGNLDALLVYFMALVWAKILLESVNYIEHYGLVRAGGTAIFPRHSWNTNRCMSSMLLFNLTRHSAHHAKSNLPYWKLSPNTDAPELPIGYLGALYLALICPPLYRKMMESKLLHWDRYSASDDEKEIVSQFA